jgi:hypothetical protein
MGGHEILQEMREVKLNESVEKGEEQTLEALAIALGVSEMPSR